MPLRSCLILTVALLVQAALFAQEPQRTRINISGDLYEFNKNIYADGPRILGNVVMNHDSVYLYCDSAWVNEAENRMTAYSNVQIKLSDTLNLYSDSGRYDGNTRIAYAYSNVRLVDNQTTLTTDSLRFDRNTQIARYDCWGKLVNGPNNLVSHYGYYYTDIKEFFFREKVLMHHPGYRMFSDTLKYNTVSEVSWFFGPSHIISNDKEDSIYCENGWYDTRLDRAFFRERAKIYHKSTFLTGDSMYYERTNGFGQVYRHALIVDTAENVLMMGNYGEMQRKRGFAYMTDSAVGVLVDKKDSLFMHSDTVRALYDSLEHIRQLLCYRKMKFFRADLQGMSDSLAYTNTDSTLTMYRQPVIWSDSSQFTADSIKLAFRNGDADSLKMYGNAFITSRDDSINFNQIKGRTVLAKFRNNDLYKINVIGNAQSVYFAREENKAMIGINMAVASDMLIFLDSNQIRSITYKGNPDAHLIPEKSIQPEERRLKGFRWEQERRPMKKEDIFVW